MRRPPKAGLFLLALLVSASQCAPPVHDGPLALRRCVLNRPPVARWTLPNRFREVSGLAALGDTAVLVHGDERARVGVFDLASGEITADYRSDDRTREDFEGIAWVDDRFVLMNSDGELFSAPGLDTGGFDYQKTKTGFSQFCELEGLAWEPGSRVLLLPCKTPKDARLFDALAVFRWSLDDDAPAVPGQLTVPSNVLSRTLGSTLFRATAIEHDSVTGHLLVLSSAPALVIELDLEGGSLASVRLDPRRHPRAEGIAIVGDLVLIADEGVGKDARGSITAYACSS